MIIFLTERAQELYIMCTNACSLTSLKQFLNFTQQKLVKRINICCKVTFGFKYSKTGVYMGYKLFFVISAQNIDCGYSLEPPRRGGSNE